MRALKSLFSPLQERLARVDLREHEDKILVVLALVISATVGLVVVGFLSVTEWMGKVLVAASPARRLLSPLIGSLIGGWLLFRFFPDSRGSGIPQTRVALLLRNGYIGMRTVIGKFICSSISLGSGVALGREGPSVQIGAGIASAAGRRLGLSPEHIRSLIPVGTAAAVAAAFNTPLAAVLFTLEEILADLHARVVGTVVIGAATSWIVLRLILGDEPLFHVPAYQLVHPSEFLIYAFLGVVTGLISTVFVKLLLWQRGRFLTVPARWKPFSPAVGGLVVGLLALWQPGVLGVGYNLVSEALNSRMELKIMLLLLALKVIATATCYGSGNAGGIFGPSLFIGAMVGGSVGQIAHTLFPDLTGNAGAYALVGMGAAFAGIVRTPMTSVIMIFEVTRDYTIIVPLMIANLCSYLLAQRLQRLPIYESLSAQEGITMPSAAHLPVPLRVEQAMRPLSEAGPEGAPYAHPDDPLDAALQRLGKTGVSELQVLSRSGGAAIGVISADDVIKAYARLAEKPDADDRTAARNWMPVVAAITVAAVLIVSSLVFWQRVRQVDMGAEALHSGEKLMAQGQTDEAILAFRNALAHAPGDAKARAALGLALVDTGHFSEASAYLNEAAKADPQDGQIAVGLAKVAAAAGEKAKALEYYRQALAKEWSGDAEFQRRNAQLAYANLLSGAGRTREAVSLLLAIIEQSGDDAALGKRAAEAVRTIGSPEQAEQAYGALSEHFPADSGVWLKLGDARYAANKDALALDAYKRALKVDPENDDARELTGRLADILHVDPTQRGLSVRERGKRWHEMLERVIGLAEACGTVPPSTEQAQALLKKNDTSVETVDAKMQSALRLWKDLDPACHKDPVLVHVMAKLGE